MADERERPVEVDSGMLAFGVVLGMFVGGVVALLTAPRRKGSARHALATLTERAKGRIETAVPADPVEESLAVGRAAARRRREELGYATDATEADPAAPR